MLKYVYKFAMDILPSVVATIIGAYIVNHYIVTKPAADAPVAAAVSTANPKGDAKSGPDGSADVASIPEAGVKAKGISEKAVLEKSAIEKSADKSGDKIGETASIPADARKHQPAPREKVAAKPVQTPAVAAPAAVVPVTPAPAEATVAPDDKRDANDLARAAIDRLRGSNEAPARVQETRTPETPRVVDAPRAQEAPRVVSVQPVQPLPPPIMVSTPTVETRPPYVPAARSDEARRLTPPAEIPLSSRPLDLHAEMSEPKERTTVAEDVLSAAKSVFHAVLPK